MTNFDAKSGMPTGTEFKGGTTPISELKKIIPANGFTVLALLDQQHPDYHLGEPNRLLVVKKTGASTLSVQFADADIANNVGERITHENFKPTAKLEFNPNTGEGIVISTKPEDSSKEVLRIPANPKLFDVMK